MKIKPGPNARHTVDGIPVLCGFRPNHDFGIPTRAQCLEMNLAIDRWCMTYDTPVFTMRELANAHSPENNAK